MLERTGKPYRPIDFALALNTNTDDEEDSSEMKKGHRSASLGANLGNAAFQKTYTN